MKKFSYYLMGILYILAGFNHFINSGFYISIMPDYLPWHYSLVLISGVFEILLGILVLIPKTRRYAAWGIILLLIAVFPANIQMAKDWYCSNNPYLWLAIVRLPIQLLLIAWAWIYTKKNYL